MPDSAPRRPEDRCRVRPPEPPTVHLHSREMGGAGRWRAVAAGTVLLALASCSGGGDGAVPTTSAVPSEDTNPIVRRNVDGVFRIGVWLPQSGPAAALGSPLAAGVELAVKE